MQVGAAREAAARAERDAARRRCGRARSRRAAAQHGRSVPRSAFPTTLVPYYLTYRLVHFSTIATFPFNRPTTSLYFVFLESTRSCSELSFRAKSCLQTVCVCRSAGCLLCQLCVVQWVRAMRVAPCQSCVTAAAWTPRPGCGERDGALAAEDRRAPAQPQPLAGADPAEDPAQWERYDLFTWHCLYYVSLCLIQRDNSLLS